MKRIWFMVLFIFCVIYSQEDTLRVTSTSGESHEIVLGISQGMSYYLENMLFSYDTSSALVPDTEGIRLLRESGIKIIRFWIDDWKEYIGPPDSDREGSNWFYDSSLGHFGYIFSTRETLYIPPHASHASGFNYGLKQLQMLYDEAGMIFAPVYEYIQDTSICHGLTVDSTICWDVYYNAIEFMEYLFGDPTKSLWAKFRVEVDSVPKYSPEAFKNLIAEIVFNTKLFIVNHIRG